MNYFIDYFLPFVCCLFFNSYSYMDFPALYSMILSSFFVAFLLFCSALWAVASTFLQGFFAFFYNSVKILIFNNSSLFPASYFMSAISFLFLKMVMITFVKNFPVYIVCFNFLFSSLFVFLCSRVRIKESIWTLLKVWSLSNLIS